MPALLFILYAVVEVAALVWAVSSIGVLATVGLLIAGSGLGVVMMRSQGRRVLEGLTHAARGGRSPGGAIADGALVALGATLMVIPGLVSSAIGLLLLIPPTRVLARPIVMFLVARRLGALTAAAGAGGQVFGRSGVVDADVIDGEVVEETYDPRPQTGVRGVTRADSNETGWRPSSS